MVHFEDNNPFTVVEELVREIEISHWCSIQIADTISYYMEVLGRKVVSQGLIIKISGLLTVSSPHSSIFMLNFPLGPILFATDTIVHKLINKVVLPDGSIYASAIFFSS